jgi:signal transduction histidine kinase
MVMIVDPSRRILLGNRALAEFSAGQDMAAVVGMRPGEILTCQHAQKSSAGCGTTEACSACGSVDAIQAALAGKQATHECRILRRGQQGVEALDLRVSGTPFSWSGETLALVVAVDISDEKRRQLLERIFFHDLLNTAGVISGLTELIMQGITSLDDVKECLHGATQSLVAEIRNQRELLAAERNELTVSPTPVHSRLFLEKAVNAYRTVSLDRGCTVKLAPVLADIIIFSDGHLLDRVIGNLIKNAIEASGAGECVTVGCVREGAEIAFWCNNAGEIPRDIQLQLFHRSFSTKEPGRGVGTYSVKLLTERYLKGRVSFTSAPDDGTTFIVTLPLDIRD